MRGSGRTLSSLLLLVVFFGAMQHCVTERVLTHSHQSARSEAQDVHHHQHEGEHRHGEAQHQHSEEPVHDHSDPCKIACNQGGAAVPQYSKFKSDVVIPLFISDKFVPSPIVKAPVWAAELRSPEFGRAPPAAPVSLSIQRPNAPPVFQLNTALPA